MAFLETYPCFFVLASSGWPDCMKSDAGRALCLFTDEKLVERYCTAKRRAMREQLGQDVRQFHAVRIRHVEGLLAALHKHAAALSEKDVEFVVIDPTGERRTPWIPLTDFLDDLQHAV